MNPPRLLHLRLLLLRLLFFLLLLLRLLLLLLHCLCFRLSFCHELAFSALSSPSAPPAGVLVPASSFDMARAVVHSRMGRKKEGNLAVNTAIA